MRLTISSPGKSQENSNYNCNDKNSHESKPWEGKSHLELPLIFDQKKPKVNRETGKYGPYKGGEINQGKLSEKAQTLNYLIELEL